MKRALSTLLAALLLAAAPGPGRAEGGDLPARNQALLLLRVLAYDRNLKARAGAAVRVLVVYRAGDRASEDRRDAVRSAFESVAGEVVVAGLPVKVSALAYEGPALLAAALEAEPAALAYVDPALGRAVPELAAVTRGKGVLTATGARALVEAGLSVGVVALTGRAGVVVNLRASRLEGADLDAALLAVSDVLRE
jgi:hypothetical protein